MQYLLLALACLQGQECVRMHSDILYYTEETCIQETEAIYLELFDLIEEKKMNISMYCVSSTPIPRPQFL